MSAENALQVAIYSALTGDSGLMAAVSGVYDDVPQDASFPYVEMGESVAADWDSDTHNGQDHLFTVHTWSQAEGRKECKTIQALIYAILHNATLSMSGHGMILCRQISSEVFKDEDGHTHHGVQQFRIITEDT